MKDFLRFVFYLSITYIQKRAHIAPCIFTKWTHLFSQSPNQETEQHQPPKSSLVCLFPAMSPSKGNHNCHFFFLSLAFLRYYWHLTYVSLRCIRWWFDTYIVILSELSQTEKDKLWYRLYVESKKKWYKWTYLQNRNRFTDVENKLMVTKGERAGR